MPVVTPVRSAGPVRYPVTAGTAVTSRPVPLLPAVTSVTTHLSAGKPLAVSKGIYVVNVHKVMLQQIVWNTNSHTDGASSHIRTCQHFPVIPFECTHPDAYAINVGANTLSNICKQVCTTYSNPELTVNIPF